MTANHAGGVVSAVVSVLLIAVSAVGLASDSSASDGGVAIAQLPPRTGIWPVNFTLYGGHSVGWGFSNASVSEPGPNITVYLGDLVQLTLVADFVNDSQPHNWFIDYNGDGIPNGDEPSSPDFNVPGLLVAVWNFTAFHPGNWTYRCRIHPTTMTGAIQILAEPRPVNLTLHGRADLGWGFSNDTIKSPGPPLVVLWGTNVRLTLVTDFLNDSTFHNWFIDYDGRRDPSAGEPSSPDFNDPVGQVIVFPFIADRTGNWTYLCRYHISTMTGNISIVGGPPPEFPTGTLPLITSIMLGALAFVLLFGAVYHYRAVRAAKRSR